MRVHSRTRNPHSGTQTLFAVGLALAIGASAAWAQSQPLTVSPSPIDNTAHDALERELGYLPREDIQLSGSAVLDLAPKVLPEGIRDYPASQCTHFVAHYIFDRTGLTTFFFPGRKDPRDANDFRRHHKAIGGKEGASPMRLAVLVTNESRYGHVAVVTDIGEDGSVYVEERNANSDGKNGTRWRSRDEVNGVKGIYLYAPGYEPAPSELDIPVQEGTSDEYTLPASAVAKPGEKPTHFTGRFQQVPADLAPLYEAAARKYQFPVRYLAADGSYETHFTSKLGDGGKSCGIHQFYAQGKKNWPKNWGFENLDACMDPEQNIMKVAEAWSSWREKKCKGNIKCAIQLHNSGARGYSTNVMHGGDTYYK